MDCSNESKHGSKVNSNPSSGDSFARRIIASAEALRAIWMPRREPLHAPAPEPIAATEMKPLSLLIILQGLS
jgi:hypothetical protein